MKSSVISTSLEEFNETHMSTDERDEVVLNADIVHDILESWRSQLLTQQQFDEVIGVK